MHKLNAEIDLWELEVKLKEIAKLKNSKITRKDYKDTEIEIADKKDTLKQYLETYVKKYSKELSEENIKRRKCKKR